MVETSRHSRMGRQQVAGSGNGQGRLERESGFFHERIGPLQHQKSGVSFVHVAHFRLDNQGHEQFPAADAENDFLLDS